MNILGIINISISSGTLIIILTAVFKLGRFTQRIESDIFNLKNSHTQVREMLEHQCDEVETLKVSVEVLKTIIGIEHKNIKQE